MLHKLTCVAGLAITRRVFESRAIGCIANVVLVKCEIGCGECENIVEEGIGYVSAGNKDLPSLLVCIGLTATVRL